MRPVRVLMADDSVLVGRLVTRAIAHPRVEIVGVASTGPLVLAKVALLAPDVVILDVDLPGTGGLAVLAAIRREWPDLPVVMLGTLTERGMALTVEALALGASDHATKPCANLDVGGHVEVVREQLLPKVLALGNHTFSRLAGSRLAPARAPVAAPPASAPVAIVAIGASSGGPHALATILSALPGDLPVPIVVAQHLPPRFTALLAERLDATCALRVREAAGDELLAPGDVWLAPGGRHLEVARDGPDTFTRVADGRAERGCRPAVDVLFRSVAHAVGSGAAGVVLTGAGVDGLHGAGVIVHAGGFVLAQDDASSVVGEMPGSIASSGLAAAVVALPDLGGELVRRVGSGRQVLVGGTR